MRWVFIGSLLLLTFDSGRAFQCPNESFYNAITTIGCYKVVLVSNKTWSQARDDCVNDTNATVPGGRNPNARAHLLSIEHSMKFTGISNWLDAFGLHHEFWIDGDLPQSVWTWSNQPITWFFTAAQRNIIGNATKYKLSYNPSDPNVTKYRIGDENPNEHRRYICEYQVPCDGNGTCKNGATCYINMGRDLCLCASGYTGEDCTIEIDECLEATCLHGGTCIDLVNNYTCNCTGTYHEGHYCEIPIDDDQKGKRTTAFWSVLGVVTGLVVFLTLSDLPWEDILSAVGCSCHRLGCCSKKDETKNNDNDILTDPAIIYEIQGGKKLSLPHDMSGAGKTNYHMTNSVWDTEYPNNRMSANPQYNGYHSPDQLHTSASSHVKTYTNVVAVKQKGNQGGYNYVQAVNVNEPKPRSKDSVEGMVHWTQQLQEQLKHKKQPRETSASSTKQLIHKTYSNDS